MTNQTITASYLTGITLTATNTTIASTGSVTNNNAAAVSGLPGTAWTLVNQGGVTGIGADGVDLATGGFVSNAFAANVVGYTGVDIRGATGTVVNGGSIAGTASRYAGVALAAGGSVTNVATGMLIGYNGIRIGGSAGTVMNNGKITTLPGAGTDGVNLLAGGSVTNASYAAINGGTGVYIGGGAGTMVNAGTIAATGAGHAGVDLTAGGLVSNAASAEITGYTGVDMTGGGGGKVANAGRISTLPGTATEGVALHSGGTVNNAAGGTIVSETGVTIGGGAGTVVNGGRIQGAVFGGHSYFAIRFDEGGVVTNQTAAVISGFDGIYIGGAGSVVNAGSIIGKGMGNSAGVGIDLLSSGYVNNAVGALISGYTGVLTYGGTAAVVNAGTIIGSGRKPFERSPNYGVALGAGGSVTNTAQGVIDGYIGVHIAGSGTVANAGSIIGSGGANYAGVALASGIVSNASSGVITGGRGILLYGATGTVVNAGTITGANGTAVALSAADSNLLVVDPGAVFNGRVVALNASSTLELAAAASAGTISGIGSSFTGIGTIVADAGATWTVLGPVTNVGTISLGAGTDVVFDGSVAATAPIDFIAATGTLGLADPGDFLATVFGLRAGNAIDFTSIVSSGGITAGIDGANRLTLTNHGTVLAKIQLDPNGNFTGDSFHVGSDGSGGTRVDVQLVPCFCAGTRIRTARGDIAVEALTEGEAVITESGNARPIRWIGRRSYAGRFIRGNRDVLPIRIDAGALADNVPARNLWLSPLHALYIDGMLIPAAELVNGTSIVQATTVEQVQYYHVELDTHDVLLAEATPAESFVDDNSRGMFRNAADYWAAHPGQPRGPARYCAPRVTQGYALEAIRRRIAARTGLRQTEQRIKPGSLRGYLEVCTSTHIAGWAQDTLHQHVPVSLAILVDGCKLGEILASERRPDLLAAGVGIGRHGFSFFPNAPIAATDLDRVVVMRPSDGAVLPYLKSSADRLHCLGGAEGGAGAVPGQWETAENGYPATKTEAG